MKDGPEGDVVASRLDAVEVGRDDDGHPITSCVVVPVDGPSPPRQKPPACRRRPKRLCGRYRRPSTNSAPSQRHQITSPPGCASSPSISGGTTPTAWASAPQRKTRAKQQAFKRASEQLIGGGHVGRWADHVWLTKE